MSIISYHLLSLAELASASVGPPSGAVSHSYPRNVTECLADGEVNSPGLDAKRYLAAASRHSMPRCPGVAAVLDFPAEDEGRGENHGEVPGSWHRE